MSEGEKRAQAVTDFLTSLQAQREALGIPPAASPQEFSDEYWDNLFYEAKKQYIITVDLSIRERKRAIVNLPSATPGSYLLLICFVGPRHENEGSPGLC